MNQISDLKQTNLFYEFTLTCLRVVSFLVYAVGFLNVLYDTMLIGVLILWGCNVAYSMKKSRLLFLVFNLVLFVFLISRPTIDLFRKDMWWQYRKAENLFSLSSLYISMIFLWIGYAMGEKIIKKCENKPKKMHTLLNVSFKEGFTKNLEFISLALFYISVFSLFVVELEKFLYMRGRNYEEIYVSFRTQLPFFVNAIASMNKYFLCVFLATMPSKRKAVLPLFLYVFSAVPYFLIGARFKLVVNALFMVVYFIIRETLENKKTWIGKFEKMTFVVSAPLVIAFLGAYNYIREGKKVAYKGFFDLIVDFFYKQGVSFEILKIGYKTLPKIKYTGFVNYTFGEILDYLMHSNISSLLFGTKVFQGGQNKTLGLYSNLLAHRMAYTAAPGWFLEGHGWGSCYLLDTYADWGYLGIIIFSIFLGLVFSSMIYFVKKGKFWCTVVLLALTSIYYCPRSCALSWISFIVYLQFYVPLAICFVGAVLLIKNYSLKNQLACRQHEF